MRLWRAVFSVLVVYLVCLWGGVADTARAALSESGGTGILELQSAESKRPARLEIGFSGSYQQFELRDAADTRLNVLRGAANAAFGLPGGFELSGTVPALFHYTSQDAAASPLDEELDVKLGDVAGRLRWTGPLGMPGLRWGLEGEALFATGSDLAETYPDRAPVKPYTVGKNSYSARTMLTWDGLRAGSGVPLRLHANAAYTSQQDEGRFLIPRAPLPLELGAPARARDNDFASLGAAVELDLQRLTLFGEVVTDQFVHERTLLKGKENRIAVTPGVRLWLPGGVSLMGAYSMSLSEDDEATAFDPGRAFPEAEWRVALSLGTVYRGARARAAEAAPLVVPAPAPAPAMAVVTEPAPPDSAALAKLRKEREIMERRDVQDEPRAAKSPAASPEAAGGPEVSAVTSPQAVAPSGRLLDSDRDGIPDVQDQCPLLAEDFDGFQDRDGCPELDNDQDGIPDIRDQCPNDPETFNGYYDLDGCPDETPVRWIGPPPGRLMPPHPAAPPDTSVSAAALEDTMRAARKPAAKPAAIAPAVAPVLATAKTPVPPAAAGPGTGPPPAAAPPAVTAAPVAVAPVPVVAAAPGTGPAPAAAPPAVTAAPVAATPVPVVAVAPGTGPAPAVAPPAVTAAPVAATPVPVVAVAPAPGPSAAVSAPAVMPAQVAVTPVPPPAVGPSADSLRLALQFEQERAKSLAARLAQSEAERRELTSRVTAPPAAAVPESIGPAPVVRPAAGRTELRAALDETQRQNDELRTRVRDLELQQLLQGQATRTTPVAVPQGPTLITAPGATSGADLAARVAALESELGEVRAQAALPRATGAADTAAGVVAARLQAIDARLATVQADLREAAAAPAAPPGPADVASPARSAPALDILLPAGTPRVFPEIEFRSGSVRVPPGAVSVLSGVAEAIRGVPEARVRIVGYTDNVGLAARNLALSRERAQAVANVLIENGVDSERLTVEGRGEESPVASNGTAAGRRLNRRVEFVRTR